MSIITAHEFIDAVIDPDSFSPWDHPPIDVGAKGLYLEQLRQAQRTSGVDESVITGRALLGGRPVALIVGEFNFLAGTIGRSSSHRIVTAIDRAADEGLPLIASPVSGGTRMQEGTLAFFQLVKISQALRVFRDAGLPYLVYVRHPMAGGPVVSWGSLGHVTFAQPDAMIGLLGPRVCEVLTGEKLPRQVQRAENLADHGIIDGVLELSEARPQLLKVLEVFASPSPTYPDAVDDVPPPSPDAWDCIKKVSDPQRPRLDHLIKQHAQNLIPLLGTGPSMSPGSLRVGLAKFPDFACMLIGHTCGEEERVVTFAELALIQRAVTIAGETRLPIVTFIDTPGIEITESSEEAGMARQIARTVDCLASVDTSVVSVILGAGTGVSALTLLPSDATVSSEYGYVIPLPAEAASEILYSTTDRAEEIAAAQGIRSVDLFEAGLIDRVVPEATSGGHGFSQRLLNAIATELERVSQQPTIELLAARQARYRAVS